MITVYVLVTFYDANGIHEKGTVCQVKESDFDPNYMKKLETPTVDAYTKEETDNLLAAKQDDLVAGTGIDITGDEISCTVDPSEVSVTQVVSTGTKIATITVDGNGTDLYAPASGGGSATKFTVCGYSDSRTVSFRAIQSSSDYALVVNNAQKTIEDVKNAFEHGGAIIIDADSSEAVVTGVIVSTGGGTSSVTIIATCMNDEIRLFSFTNSWGTQFRCNVAKSLSS